MSELTPITRVESYLDAIVNSGTPPLEDITRIETFLQAIYDNQVCALTPITRIEMFLGKISGQDIVLPEPITRIELYLAAIAGEDVELPENPITRLEMYLAEWADSGDWTTISGAIVEFITQRAHKLKSCVVSLSPRQDLHGYDSPWPPGGGKNLFNKDEDFSANNYYYNVSGEQITSANYRTTDYIQIKPNTTYYWAINGVPPVPNPPVHQSPRVTYYDSEKNWLASGDELGPSGSAYTSTATAAYARLPVYVAIPDTMATAMFSEGNSIPTTYSPYSNICPISGYTGVEAWRTGANLIPTINVRTPQVSSGLTLTIDDDGALVLNGTSTATGTFVLAGTSPFSQTLFTLKKGTYNIGIGEAISQNCSFSLYDWVSGRSMSVNGNQGNKVQTLTEDLNVTYIRLQTYSGTYDNTKLYPMLSVGDTAQPYETYKGNFYSVTFGETVYGATPDIVSGEMPVTTGYVDLGTLRWAYISAFNCFYAENPPRPLPKNGFNALCSQYKFVGSYPNLVDKSCAYIYNNTIAVCDSAYGADATAFKTAMSGVQLAYELATPIETAITPTPITALKGYNAMWSNAGDIEVTVHGTSVEVETLQALNMLLGGAYRNNQTAEDVSDEEALDIILGGENK